MTRPRRQTEITPELLIRAYSIGLFPMAEDRDSESLFWVEPEARGVFPLDQLIISKSLAKAVRSEKFAVRADGDFEGVMRACAERDKTWINPQILKLYCALHRMGHAHSIEVRQDGALVGGLYGVSLGAAFFGESMFHRATDASKVALVHLAARLKLGGYRLLDAQFLTPHLASLGAIEISRGAYKQRLEAALAEQADFTVYPVAKPMSGALALALALGPRGAAEAGAA